LEEGFSGCSLDSARLGVELPRSNEDEQGDEIESRTMGLHDDSSR
jgi:hypothetical protein